jgi:hypothetical protein
MAEVKSDFNSPDEFQASHLIARAANDGQARAVMWRLEGCRSEGRRVAPVTASLAGGALDAEKPDGRGHTTQAMRTNRRPREPRVLPAGLPRRFGNQN